MRVAIVLPTLDEQTNLERRLPALVAAANLVVVSDGGSTDSSCDVAERAGCLLVRAPAGRGPQLNAGARVALEHGADALLFLHADTELPVGAVAAVRSALEEGAAGGGFLVRLVQPRGLLRLLPPLVNWRTRHFRVPLGDQAQFSSRDAFERLGGFRDWPILEDFDFVLRLRRLGRLAVIETPVAPSTRRFEAEGVLRTVVRNWVIWGLYFCGVSPARLARWYRRVR